MKIWNTLIKRVEKFAEKFQGILLQRFHRIVSVEKNTLSKNKDGYYLPILKKGQLVNAEFISQGSVLDENHPAIVWAADKKSEHIIIIPLTSKDGDGRYEKRNLGIIKGYNNLQSIVKINQPHSVSRKSITLIKQEIEGKKFNVFLSDAQLIILEDYFREYYLKEPSLRNVVENKIGLFLPLNISESDIIQSNRPVIYEVKDNILWYRFSDQSNMNRIDLIKFEIRTAERKEILSNLFSDDINVRKLAYKGMQVRSREKVI